MIAKWNHDDRGKNALKPATGHKICGWKSAGQFADQKQNMLDQNLWLSINLYQSIPIGSMYAIYGNIYHNIYHKYTIHGSYAILKSVLFNESITADPTKDHIQTAVTEAPAPPRQRATAARAALKMKLPLKFWSSCVGDFCRCQILKVPRVSSFQLKDIFMEKKDKTHPNLGMGQNLLLHIIYIYSIIHYHEFYDWGEQTTLKTWNNHNSS